MRRFLAFRSRSPRVADLPPVSASWTGASPPTCPVCRALLAGAPRYVRHRVCDNCGFHFRLGARERLARLVDPDTFRETDAHLVSDDPIDFADDLPYRDRLVAQREQTGLTDAAVTGTGKLRGHRVSLAVLDFGFMGGSMGVVVGEKVARAAEVARRERQPLVTVVASGGARMQEGILSLLQMAKTAAAIQRLHDEGVPHLSVLTNPTTGGVFASFASLGDVIVAEPAALIGFAGPRVVEQTLGVALPPGSHTAEFLLAHGMIDDVVDRGRLRAYLGTLLDTLDAPRSRRKPAGHPMEADAAAPRLSPWEIVQRARDPERPTALDYIERMTEGFVELHGDRESGDDPAIVAGVGLLDGRPLAIVGMERGHGEDAARRHFGRPYPEGYRKAQRLMRLAARVGLPVVTLVDTPGAYPGVEAEERGLAGEIAETLALMSGLQTSTVAVVIGEGGSGGALALALADRVLMQEQAIYSVIAPEGAAAILYRDAGRAAEIAPSLRLVAPDLRQVGVVDAIVPEPSGGARCDPDAAAAILQDAIVRHLDTLQAQPIDRLVRARFERYQRVGRDRTGIEEMAHRDPRANRGEPVVVEAGTTPGASTTDGEPPKSEERRQARPPELGVTDRQDQPPRPSR